MVRDRITKEYHRRPIYGSLQVTIHESSIDFSAAGCRLDEKSPSNVHVEISIASPSSNSQSFMVLEPVTETIASIFTQKSSLFQLPSENISWDESLDIRCCIGWQLFIGVIISMDDDSANDISLMATTKAPHSDLANDVTNVIDIGNTLHAIKYDLMLSDDSQAIVGELEISLDYFPNHQSFRCLSIDCSKSIILPRLLLSELLKLSDSETGEIIQTPGGSALPGSTAALVESALLLNKFTNLNNTNSMSIGNGDRDLPLFSIIPDSTESVYAFKAVYIAKSSLAKIGQLLPQAPALTVESLEKQLSIFLDVILNGQESAVSAANLDLCEEQISLHHVMLFIVVAGLWVIQQAFITNSLIKEFDISIKELSEIRNRFTRYDNDLNGDISRGDLFYLLQDMGETYTPDEVNIIVRDIDPDGVDCLDFSEFVRWWCAS